jgi:hypothetical protein
MAPPRPEPPRGEAGESVSYPLARRRCRVSEEVNVSERFPLERSVIIPAGPICLDGLYLPGKRSPALLFAGAHPALGGAMEHPILNEMAYRAVYSGRSSLRFWWRGVGGSEGERSTAPAALAEDLGHALRFLWETTRQEAVALVGHQSGCPAVLAAALEETLLPGAPLRCETLVLVAPPRALTDGAAIVRCPRPTLLLAGTEDLTVDVGGLSAIAAGETRASVRCIFFPEADQRFHVGLSAAGRSVVEWLDRLGSDSP